MTPFAAHLGETRLQAKPLGLRSLTCVKDIIEGLTRTLDKVPDKNASWDGHAPDPGTSLVAPYRIYNVGNDQPVDLLGSIEVLEACFVKKAKMDLQLPLAGDVPDTEADVSESIESVGYRPVVSVEEGVANFVRWYRGYYDVE